MNALQRRRMWRVTRSDGSAVQVSAAKVVVTNGAGALMFLDALQEANPVRIFAAGSWSDCAEVRKGGRR
jgi:hypothetical protein